jgi:protein translocase, SecG subunit
MNAIQIISGILLIISSLVIIVVTLAQSNKDQGMTSAISGGGNDSFYGKNTANTREKALEKLTRICAVIFFVLTLIVNLIAVYAK